MMPRKLVMSTNVRPVTQFCFFGKFMIYRNQQLVGGFNPFERYTRQIVSSPQVREKASRKNCFQRCPNVIGWTQTPRDLTVLELHWNVQVGKSP